MVVFFLYLMTSDLQQKKNASATHSLDLSYGFFKNGFNIVFYSDKDYKQKYITYFLYFFIFLYSLLFLYSYIFYTFIKCITRYIGIHTQGNENSFLAITYSMHVYQSMSQFVDASKTIGFAELVSYSPLFQSSLNGLCVQLIPLV